MEDIMYTDYASWLIEKSDLISKLKEDNSFIYIRFKHIIDVTRYLYNRKVEDDDLDQEDENIFGIGFYYLFEQFENIDQLLKHTYDDNLEELNKHKKTIELLLNAIEFENDISYILDDPEEQINAFVELQEEIFEYIEAKKEAPEELFEKLDHVSAEIYENNDLDYYPIKEIFYDIAEMLDLL